MTVIIIRANKAYQQKHVFDSKQNFHRQNKWQRVLIMEELSGRQTGTVQLFEFQTLIIMHFFSQHSISYDGQIDNSVGQYD